MNRGHYNGLAPEYGWRPLAYLQEGQAHVCKVSVVANWAHQPHVQAHVVVWIVIRQRKV